MYLSKLPSLNGLRAFALVAKTGSFVKAAAALNVTQAAVSQQVKALETWLGIVLLIREGRGVVLSEEGKLLARDLDAGFGVIQQRIDQLMGQQETRSVQITTSPAFASEWLMPRLADFQINHPKITLMLNPTVEMMDLRSTGIDLAIRYFEKGSRDQVGMPFLTMTNVVVGVPEILTEAACSNPIELLDLPWLEELGTTNVADWFDRHHVDRSPAMSVTQMPGSLIMQAVRRGDGITQTVRDYFEDDIKAGRIVAAYPELDAGNFRILTGPDKPRAATETFIKWLKSQRSSGK